MYSFGDRTDGVKMIYPQHMEPFEAFCDQTTKGGGWTVFQKRLAGSVDFYRNWTDYKQGFGNLSGEFWLGLDKIHRLTSQTNNKLRVELEDFDGNTSYAEYDTFAVADETDNYTLSVGNYSGKCGQVWSISVVVLADSFAKCIFGPQLARFYKLARTKIGLYKEGGVGREIFELRPSPSLRCSEQNGEYQFRAPDKKLLFKRIFQNIHWLRDHSVGNEHECILDVNRTSILQYLQRLGGMFSSQALRVIHWRCTIRWPSAPKDRDNDQNSHGNCAEMYKGAWWYRRCHVSNLNALYHRGNHSSYADGVNWKTWRGYHYSFKRAEMKFRPVDFWWRHTAIALDVEFYFHLECGKQKLTEMNWQTVKIFRPDLKSTFKARSEKPWSPSEIGYESVSPLQTKLASAQSESGIEWTLPSPHWARF